MKLLNNYFENIVGQDNVKKRLNFYLEAFQRGGVFPNLCFIAPKGMGKTEIARSTTKALKDLAKYRGEEKPKVEFNCAQIDNIDLFYNLIVDQHLTPRKHCTLFGDEIHCLETRVAADFLSILNPNKQNKNVVWHKDKLYEFDFKRVTFLFATTEQQKIFSPLRDRLVEIQLDDYSAENLGKIIRLNLKESFSITEGAIEEIVKYCRGNGRDAAKLGGKEGISSYLEGMGKRKFEAQDVLKLVDILDLFPMGLQRLEINILNQIVKRKCVSLTSLSSKSGLTRSSQQNIEQQLLRCGLIEIDKQSKRIPTGLGIEYIKSIHHRLVNKPKTKLNKK